MSRLAPSLALLAALVALPAEAASPHVVAGGVCQASTGTASYPNGTLSNPSTASTGTYNCPMPMEGTSAITTNPTFYVVDPTSTGSVSCTFWSAYMATNGNSGSTSVVASTSTAGFSSSVQAITPTAGNLTWYAASSTVAPWYFVSCNLPASSNGQTSKLISVSYTEP